MDEDVHEERDESGRVEEEGEAQGPLDAISRRAACHNEWDQVDEQVPHQVQNDEDEVAWARWRHVDVALAHLNLWVASLSDRRHFRFFNY